MNDLMNNWAERYTGRFIALMVVSLIIQVCVFGLYVRLQRRRGQQDGPRPRFTIGGAAAGAVFPLLLVISVVLMSWFLLVQTLVLLALTLLSHRLRWPPKRFVVVASMLVVVIIAAAGGRGVIRAEQARREYPFESLTDRLQPTDQQVLASPKLTESSEKVLLRTEKRMDRLQENTFGGYIRRRASLEMVHATQVLNFITSEGFGIGRMLGPDIAGARIDKLRKWPQPVVLQPGDADSTGEKSELWLPLRPGTGPRRPLTSLHEALLLDFANPRTYGWVRDLEHVTGFRSHGLDRFEPSTRKFEVDKQGGGSGWQLERIELVSLLKTAKPTVYLSENLPRMDELAGSERRSLDGFETIALRELHDGKTLVIRSQGERMRMMGALRSARQCSLCHEVPRGTLLGAFSYCFRDQTSARSSE
ncbi:MAG: hypothetical protein VX304_09630 [Planctomycetota bacterium]|nr:hypothetical protein [Planctomycetota bacterium]